MEIRAESSYARRLRVRIEEQETICYLHLERLRKYRSWFLTTESHPEIPIISFWRSKLRASLIYRRELKRALKEATQ
jgi:hypothetical protein